MGKDKKVEEPQDVAEVGPTPYEYLFSETIETIPDFVDQVKKTISEDK